MFESKTYSAILSKLLAAAGSYGSDDRKMDTSEGSLLWNLLSIIAAYAEEIYQDMDTVYSNISADTQDREHLISSGALEGIPIYSATSGEFKAQFNMPIPIGTVFEAIDHEYQYTAMSVDNEEKHVYNLTSLYAGSEPNTYLGEIEPVEWINGYEDGKIIECVIPGEDAESTEDYRWRRMVRYQERPFGGNRAYYVDEVTKLAGVGGVKAERATADDANVYVTIIGSDYNVPSAELVDQVQEAVDPVHTEGNGIAPIGAKVVVKPVEAATVDIGLSIKMKSGYSYAEISKTATNRINEYLSELCSDWAHIDNIIVRRLEIEKRIADIDSVDDLNSITLNNEEKNLVLNADQIPVLETITATEAQ